MKERRTAVLPAADVTDGREDKAEEPDEKSVEDDDEQDLESDPPPPHQYPHLPVHISLEQASCLLTAGIIHLVDGSSISALRLSRFGAMDQSQRVQHSIRERTQLLLQQRGQSMSSESFPDSAVVDGPASSSPDPATSTSAIALSMFSSSSFTLPTFIQASPSPLHASRISPPSSVSPSLPPTSRILSLLFSDLYRRGFTLTSGVQYGGDFLLYDHDPSACHSHSVVKAVKDKRGEGGVVSGMQLLTMARVGSGVRKSVVLACVDGQAEDESGGVSVDYTTWQWEPALSKAKGS